MVEEKKDKEQTKSQAVVLAEVPTQYGLVYQTPDGELSQEQYLVWLGNMLVEIKQSLLGS